VHQYFQGVMFKTISKKSFVICCGAIAAMLWY